MKHYTMLPRGVSLLAVLMLCTLFVSGQTQLQFWFDSDKTKRLAEIPASGTLYGKMDMSFLPNGFHTMYMRVKQTGAQYQFSPITMSSFIKFATGEGSKLQYWFDDDVNNFSTIDVDAESGKPQTLMLDLSNIERFPMGVHQLNMRVAHNGGHYSPVYSANVLRLPAGTGNSMLEYWFDDDYENHASIAVSTDKNGIQKLDLDLSDQTKFPYGLHRLNMRVAQNGVNFSPVYSAIVMRLRAGANNYLTYWLDDDYANKRRTWSTTGNGKDAYFKVRLDFTSATEGMHRLHYRISSQAQDDGPVYEVPVLVSRRYNTQDNVTIVKEESWLDVESPFIKTINNQSHIYSGSYELDPLLYAAGQQHAFYMQFQNSAGVWTPQNVTYFYKDTDGKLRAGRINPDDDGDVTAVDGTATAEHFRCYYRGGAVVVDCQSAKLASTGVIMVCDLTGKVIARVETDCNNGLHVELPVGNIGRQMLIVKVFSGDVHFTRKLMAR